MLLVLVLIGALCVALSVYFIVSCDPLKILPKIPYYKFNPNYPFFIERWYTIVKLSISTAEERLSIITALCLQCSDMVKVWFGPVLVVFVSQPERIKKILMSPKCADKWNLFYSLIERDDALTFARATSKMKEHRKFFSPCFSLPAQGSFVKVFYENSKDICETLKQETTWKEFDFHLYAKKFCFDILCEAMVDIKPKSFFDETTYERIFIGFETTEEAFGHKLQIPYLYPNTLYKLTRLRREEKKGQQILKEFLQLLTEGRRSIMREKASTDDDERCILLDHIIRNEDKFTDKEIRDHFENFIAAYEILGNAVAHQMLLLAMHPDIQEKLYESIRKSILSDDDVSNLSIVMHMEYLDAVMKEAFRLMPAIPIVLREVVDDFEIEPGVLLPKGLKLVMNISALHRRKDIWGNDSDEFRPERWITGELEHRHQFSFLPFSAGSRICMGNRFSAMAIKIATVQWVRKFKFSTSMTMDDIRVKAYISMKLCTDHRISLQLREEVD